MLQPRRWGLWQLPRWAATWLLGTELLAVGWAVSATLSATYSHWDLIRFVTLAVCATAHLVGTRESEERRRSAHHRTEHVDQTSIWLFSAALILPVPLMLALLVVLRLQRYLIARKRAHTFLFTTAAIAASALGVHTIAGATPLHAWLTGQRGWPHQPVGMLVSAGAMIAAVAVYFVAQALLVGVARALVTGERSLADMLGDRKTNTFILTTLFLAVAASLVQALSALLLLIMVPIAVRSTRVEQRLNQAQAEAKRLRADALHDPLTGLLNRRGFNPEAALALVSDQSDQEPTALLILDLDHFKSFNDRLGHIGGDQVLIAFADAVRAATRHGDLVCRWGGEEVAVVLPQTSREDAAVLAERIRATVAEMQVEVTKPAGGQVVRLNTDGEPGCTVSIGVAVSPAHGTELAELSELADQALYRAKDSGRNRVVLAPIGSSWPERIAG